MRVEMQGEFLGTEEWSSKSSDAKGLNVKMLAGDDTVEISADVAAMSVFAEVKRFDVIRVAAELSLGWEGRGFRLRFIERLPAAKA
ncbi:MAG: hypothetical protein LC808_23925 [Actinobacteria bacterium]|nr:hypothetical protein [Actinomycetota bacterium]